MTTFKDLNTPDFLVQALERLNITVPTPIQTMAIPPALEGKDILASAQTGTGKTLAFLIPMIAKLTQNPTAGALIIAPTRELAIQVRDTINTVVRPGSMHTALLIGGDPMPKQLSQLRRKPRVILGTPGRIADHLYRESLQLDKTEFLVIDEMDRMLDIGLREQLDDIINHLPATRQTVMFSATMPDHILTLSKQYLKDPARVAAGEVNQPKAQIEQTFIHTTGAQAFDDLLKELDTRSGSTIIFVRTKRGADQLADKINQKIAFESEVASAIHGDLRQRKREHVIQLFRNGKRRILVATDVAARGLDVPHVKVVINWELPENPEDYVHRIGRTGRAGATGVACSFIRKNVDERKWQEIDRLMNPEKYKGVTLERRDSSSRGGSRGRKPFFGDRDRSSSRFGGDRDRKRTGGSRFGGNRSSSDRGFGSSRSSSDKEWSSEGSRGSSDRAWSNNESRPSSRSSSDKEWSGRSRFGSSRSSSDRGFGAGRSNYKPRRDDQGQDRSERSSSRFGQNKGTRDRYYVDTFNASN